MLLRIRMSPSIHVEDLTKSARGRVKAKLTGAKTVAQARPMWRKVAFAATAALLPLATGLVVGRRTKLGGARAAGGVALGMLALRSQLQRLFTDEPAFTRETRIGALELRAYPARVEATTQIDTARIEDALDQGFHRLAGFIFGGNQTHESLPMTAPVTARGEKLAMTTPVIASDHEGSYTLAFIMPPGRDLASLPKPIDTQVHLREIPARRVAVLRFAGRHTAGNIGAHERELLRLVTAAGLEPVGKPSFAGFDPPMTLPLLRRNEVWVEIAAEKDARD